MIKEYVQLSYDVPIELYPAGCCKSCQQNMYRCKKAEDSGKSIKLNQKHEWDQLRLENICVPRISANCIECSCPMCYFAHYNPIRREGTKKIVYNPMINPDGGKMHCETQRPVFGQERGSVDRWLVMVCTILAVLELFKLSGEVKKTGLAVWSEVLHQDGRVIWHC